MAQLMVKVVVCLCVPVVDVGVGVVSPLERENHRKRTVRES